MINQQPSFLKRAASSGPLCLQMLSPDTKCDPQHHSPPVLPTLPSSSDILRADNFRSTNSSAGNTFILNPPTLPAETHTTRSGYASNRIRGIEPRGSKPSGTSFRGDLCPSLVNDATVTGRNIASENISSHPSTSEVRSLCVRLLSKLGKLELREPTNVIRSIQEARTKVLHSVETANRAYTSAQQALTAAAESLTAAQQYFRAAEEANIYVHNAATVAENLVVDGARDPSSWESTIRTIQDDLHFLGAWIDRVEHADASNVKAGTQSLVPMDSVELASPVSLHLPVPTAVINMDNLHLKSVPQLSENSRPGGSQTNDFASREMMKAQFSAYRSSPQTYQQYTPESLRYTSNSRFSQTVPTAAPHRSGSSTSQQTGDWGVFGSSSDSSQISMHENQSAMIEQANHAPSIRQQCGVSEVQQTVRKLEIVPSNISVSEPLLETARGCNQANLQSTGQDRELRVVTDLEAERERELMAEQSRRRREVMEEKQRVNAETAAKIREKRAREIEQYHLGSRSEEAVLFKPVMASVKQSDSRFYTNELGPRLDISNATRLAGAPAPNIVSSVDVASVSKDTETNLDEMQLEDRERNFSSTSSPRSLCSPSFDLPVTATEQLPLVGDTSRLQTSPEIPSINQRKASEIGSKSLESVIKIEPQEDSFSLVTSIRDLDSEAQVSQVLSTGNINDNFSIHPSATRPNASYSSGAVSTHTPFSPRNPSPISRKRRRAADNILNSEVSSIRRKSRRLGFNFNERRNYRDRSSNARRYSPLPWQASHYFPMDRSPRRSPNRITHSPSPSGPNRPNNGKKWAREDAHMARSPPSRRWETDGDPVYIRNYGYDNSASFHSNSLGDRIGHRHATTDSSEFNPRERMLRPTYYNYYERRSPYAYDPRHKAVEPVSSGSARRFSSMGQSTQPGYVSLEDRISAGSKLADRLVN